MVSDTCLLLPAVRGFPGPVEARLRRIAEENPSIFAAAVRLVLPEWTGDDARRKTREVLPDRSRQYSSQHFDRQLQLLDRIGMPFTPKGNQDLRQPPPEDPVPVHPGMAAGTERHQLGVVAGAAVMNI